MHIAVAAVALRPSLQSLQLCLPNTIMPHVLLPALNTFCLQIWQQPGGVGRNIAEALLQLCVQAQQPVPSLAAQADQPEVPHSTGTPDSPGVCAAPVQLCTLVGGDAAGGALRQHWRAAGGRADDILVARGDLRTATVAAVLDTTGDVCACVADTSIIESPEMAAVVSEQLRNVPATARIAVLDANLSAHVLHEAAQACRQRGLLVAFEPVSPAKAVRCALAPFWAISPSPA